MDKAISPFQAAQSLTEFWSPRVIGELDDSYVKVARLKGQLTWHSHENEDELFYVLAGVLHIEMEENTVKVSPGEFFIVPKGVRHNPIADEECLVMLLERKTTLHTGNTVTNKTRSVEDQLRPL
ncbi:cupin domain-containing protein [Geothrix alkalitolerans]|uniref:cupin domain-containing protein n=1 Tax=Geothrix alkalitolerans TaxID=2922724 RepID=UPI001FAED708